MRRLMIAAALLALPSPGMAQDDPLLSVQPLALQPILEAPPGGFFGIAGARTGEATPGTAYGVTRIERQPAGIGTHSVWVEIAPLAADGSLGEPAGWANYRHGTGAAGFETLGPVDPALAPILGE